MKIEETNFLSWAASKALVTETSEVEFQDKIQLSLDDLWYICISTWKLRFPELSKDLNLLKSACRPQPLAGSESVSDSCTVLDETYSMPKIFITRGGDASTYLKIAHELGHALHHLLGAENRQDILSHEICAFLSELVALETSEHINATFANDIRHAYLNDNYCYGNTISNQIFFRKQGEKKYHFTYPICRVTSQVFYRNYKDDVIKFFNSQLSTTDVFTRICIERQQWLKRYEAHIQTTDINEVAHWCYPDNFFCLLGMLAYLEILDDSVDNQSSVSTVYDQLISYIDVDLSILCLPLDSDGHPRYYTVRSAQDENGQHDTHEFLRICNPYGISIDQIMSVPMDSINLSSDRLFVSLGKVLKLISCHQNYGQTLSYKSFLNIYRIIIQEGKLIFLEEDHQPLGAIIGNISTNESLILDTFCNSKQLLSKYYEQVNTTEEKGD